MGNDTITYDSLNARPLPKWLTNQRDGLNYVQVQKVEMKEDRSVQNSFIITGFVILLVTGLLTVIVLKKNLLKKTDKI